MNRVNPAHKREDVILFRVTKAERAALEKAAAGSRSVSDWLREVVMKASLPDAAGKVGAAKKVALLRDPGGSN